MFCRDNGSKILDTLADSLGFPDSSEEIIEVSK